MIGKTVNHYRIIEKIGGGGMGAVYKAEDTKLRRTVALKFLHTDRLGDQKAQKRFLHEARAASALDHPNICGIYEINETDEGDMYIAMTYYHGESLKQHMGDGPLPLQESFEIAFSMARGLDAAHKFDITHRDIKPANIVITEDGFVKIVDFGLAKLTDQTRLTRTGTTVGTVAYMSPEQANDEDIDPRADIWSLGVVLYEMIAGRLPFRGNVEAAMLYSIMSEPHVPLTEVVPNVSEACAAVIDKCLAKDRNKRYQTIEQFIVDVVKLSSDLNWDSLASATIVPIGRYRGPRRKAAQKKIVSISAIVLVLIAAAFVAFQQRGGETSPFSTDVRLAVMPLNNLAGADFGPMTDGLSEVVSNILEAASASDDSAWLIPYPYVKAAKLPGPDAVREALGVNYVVTGDVQPYLDRHRVSLKLLDAQTLDPIRTAAVNFDSQIWSEIAQQLPRELIRLTDFEQPDTSAGALQLPAGSGAVKPYLAGLGHLQGYGAGNNLEQAIVSLETACQADSGFTPARTALGWAYWRRYERSQDESALETARAHLTQASQHQTPSADAHVYLGNISRAMGDGDAAIASFRTALSIDPDHLTASRRLAPAYWEANRADEGEAVLIAAIQSRPDFFGTQRTLGLFYYRFDRYDEAIEQFEKSLALAPNDGLSLNNLGAIHYSQGDWDRARAAFERSFRAWPECESCSNTALMLYFDGRFDESATYFEFALEYCNTTDHEAWGNWASALYWVDGQRGKAIEVFQTAIRIATDKLARTPDEDPDLIARLIDYYSMSGDDKSTREMIKRAQPFGETDSGVMKSIGDAYEKLGERKQALRYLDNAMRHHYPQEIIVRNPLLKDLLKDPVFQRMITNQENAEPTVGSKSD